MEAEGGCFIVVGVVAEASPENSSELGVSFFWSMSWIYESWKSLKKFKGKYLYGIFFVCGAIVSELTRFKCVGVGCQKFELDYFIYYTLLLPTNLSPEIKRLIIWLLFHKNSNTC